MRTAFILSILFTVPLAADAAMTAAIVVSPEQPIQGEAIRISVEGTTRASVKSIAFADKHLGVFSYRGVPTALYGVDLNKKAGTYKVVVTFTNDTTLEKEIAVGVRKKVEAPMGIPQKLGGNTKASQQKLVSTLAEENKILSSYRTGTKAFWTEPFRYPVKDVFVTDTYGYSRKTGEYSIAHKGTDFRAKEGTPIMAMNRGVVRAARSFRNYGNTVVVDHGLGLMTMYMHLSKMNVNAGELVKPGHVIGRAGSTGYAGAAHLHVSVRVSNISVDPEKFMRLFE